MVPDRTRDLAPIVVLAILVVVSGLATSGLLSGRQRLVLATTTSTYDSGLLDYLLPEFEAANHVHVRVIAVGTGQALEIARRGDADVLLTHSPRREREFFDAGHATRRLPLMYNFYLLVGPPSDPARAAGNNITAALQRIAASQSTFLSRGDGSGTHARELDLWALARITPAGRWYKDGGTGMAETLRIADQLGAYTLTDDGTFQRLRPHLLLAVIVQNEPPLENHYSVMPVNPTLHPSVRSTLAEAFTDWITSNATKARIAAYVVNGRQLFTPEG